MRLFEGERDLRFDIPPAHDKAGAAATGPAAAEQALEKIAEPALAAAATK